VNERLWFTSRRPLVQVTVLPATLQPGVGDATFVSGAGTVSVTTKPLALPGPLFVTVSVNVAVDPGISGAGPDFASARSVGKPGEAAPSLLALAGPGWTETIVKVGDAALGFVIAT